MPEAIGYWFLLLTTLGPKEIVAKFHVLLALYRREFEPSSWQYLTFSRRVRLKRDSAFPKPNQMAFFNLQHWSKSVPTFLINNLLSIPSIHWNLFTVISVNLKALIFPFRCMVYGILKNTTQVHWVGIRKVLKFWRMKILISQKTQIPPWENWRKVDVTNKCDVITDLAKFVEDQTPDNGFYFKTLTSDLWHILNLFI